MLWVQLSSCFLAPLLVQGLSIIKPRVGPGIDQPKNIECKPLVDQRLFEEQDKVKGVDYSTCSIKGYEYWNHLQETLRQPQICDRDDSKLFKEHYFAEYDMSFLPYPEFEQAYEDRKIELAKMDTWEVSGLNPDTDLRDDGPAYYNDFDTYGGIIVATGNWKSADTQQVLQWSEIIYITWQLAKEHADILATQDKDHRPGGPISNLRSVIQHTITNKVTRSVIKAAYEANGWTPGNDGPNQWRNWTEQNTKYFFFGLMGTDNVKGTVWLLNDHADEIGRKEIATIWTRWSHGSPDIW
ncbi:MAG: hypothetical protein Q9176_001165 [Flavoplaca citrina]